MRQTVQKFPVAVSYEVELVIDDEKRQELADAEVLSDIVAAALKKYMKDNGSDRGMRLVAASDVFALSYKDFRAIEYRVTEKNLTVEA